MADLNVQPKQKKSILPWLLLALGIIAALFFLLRGCNNDGGTTTGADTTASVSDGAASAAAGATDSVTAATSPDFGDVDFNAPAAAYQEITGKDISVRGNNNYAIYSLGENILFDEGKNTIRQDGDKNLKEITGSINKRFKGANIRIYGYTDSVGSKGYNKELAEQRATAVKDWMVKNGNITENNVSMQPVGESHPVATNATEEGRQQNRRVEIVARALQGGQ